MNRHAIVFFAIALVASVGMSFAQDSVRSGDLAIEKPWARASIGTSRPAAAYLTIRNEGTGNDTLLAVSSTASETAEVHLVAKDNGVMRMAPAGPVQIPAGGEVSLAPGGLHIMMTKLHAPLVEGESISLVFEFEKAGNIAVTAPIYGPGAMGPPE